MQSRMSTLQDILHRTSQKSFKLYVQSHLEQLESAAWRTDIGPWAWMSLHSNSKVTKTPINCVKKWKRNPSVAFGGGAFEKCYV